MKDNIITKVSLFFVNRSRFTILITLSLLAMGFYTYTNTLKKEGFPVINIPYIVVVTPYLSGDPAKTEADITIPIYDTVLELEEVEEINSSSSANVSTVVITLDQDNSDPYKVEELVAERVESLNLPNESQISIPEPGLVDGENDILISIYSDELGLEELQERGELLATEIERNDMVQHANVKEQFVETYDFGQNREVVVQNSFSRLITVEYGGSEAFDTIVIGIMKKNQDIGTLDFSESVRGSVEKALESEDLNDIEVSYTSDPAEQLETQISSLEENAVAAIVTIFIILLLFIDLRSALILALFIPMTLGAVFLTFTLFGLSLNTISLFSLVLVLGLFVDDGTVVVEAIDYYKRKGHKGVEAVRKAIGDIGVADISGTLTTVLVFVPLVFIEGVLGEFIKILPITVIISLLLSLLIALTILPFISKHFLKDRNGNADNRSIFERVFEYVPSKILRFGEILESYVKFALRNRLYKLFAIVMSIVLIGVGIYFSSLIGFSYFAPAKDSEEITVSISFDQPTTIESARKLSIQVEDILLQKSQEEIEEVTYLAGNSRSAQLMVRLNGITEREITSTQIAKELNVATEEFDGAIINAAVVSAGPPETQFPFAMQIYSEDQTMLENATDDIAQYIPTVKLDNDVEVVDVKSESLLEVSRKNGDRYATIRVKFSDGSDSATIVELQNAIEAEFDQNLLNSSYPGVTVGFDSGQESDNAESFASVALAGIIALIVMYGLLVLQFNSFSQPLLILLAIPFCFPGLFLGLYLTGNPMSFFVVIGLTGLIGIVVNNTIMLIEYANARRREGKDITEAISEAVRLRTRPILTTTLTTVCGLVPLALTEPFWEPLAFTIIFGLLSSMALILFAFPVFYAAVQGWRDLLYNYSPKRLRKG